jgi:protein O-GlcNAc transferase
MPRLKTRPKTTDLRYHTASQTENDMNVVQQINSLFDKGQYHDVIKSCEALLARNQVSIEIIMLLGKAHLQSGAVQNAAAIFGQALKQWPSRSEPYIGMADVFTAAKDQEQALAYLSKACEIDPRNLHLALRTVTASLDLGHYSHALKMITAQQPSTPSDEEIRLKNIASLQSMLARYDAAFSTYQQLMDSETEDIDVYVQYLANLNYPERFDSESFSKVCRLLNDKLVSRNKNISRQSLPKHIDQNRIRIGFVSADLYRHSVSFFLKPLITHLDRDTFATYCYQNSAKHDEVSDGLAELCHSFKHVETLSDAQLYKQIRDDRIDILIDLSGHTVGHRLGVFSVRAAPIQCTYLGYPNVTGIEEMDYRIIDSVTDPEQTEASSECIDARQEFELLVQTPENFICFEGPADIDPMELEANGADRPFVFGSFNNYRKISPKTIELWSKILLKVEGSQLALKSAQLFDDAAKSQLMEAFSKHGVASDQVFLFPTIGDFKQHLEFYNQIDLALDSHPYNGTTTTCEALWMGVPTVVMRGSNHASRVGASIMQHSGFSEFVAESEDDFVNIASEFAKQHEISPTPRSLWSEKFRQSRMCDGKRFASDFEGILQNMVSRYNTKSIQKDAT